MPQRRHGPLSSLTVWLRLCRARKHVATVAEPGNQQPIDLMSFRLANMEDLPESRRPIKRESYHRLRAAADEAPLRPHRSVLDQPAVGRAPRKGAGAPGRGRREPFGAGASGHRRQHRHGGGLLGPECSFHDAENSQTKNLSAHKCLRDACRHKTNALPAGSRVDED